MFQMPYPKEELPEIIGTTLFFNYINRVVDTYLTRDTIIPSTPGIVKIFMKIFPAYKVLAGHKPPLFILL